MGSSTVVRVTTVHVSAADRAARLADARTWDGFRSAHFARSTGTLVVVVQSAEAGIEDDPELPWATLCDDHSSVVCHTTLALAKAHAADPAGWCDDCRES